MYTEIPRQKDRIFAKQPLDLRRGGLDLPRPPGPSWYFGLPVMNLGRPPLPLNKPHRQQFNYHDYVKDFDLDAHLNFQSF